MLVGRVLGPYGWEKIFERGPLVGFLALADFVYWCSTGALYEALEVAVGRNQCP